MKSVERRLRALEAWQAPWQATAEPLSRVEEARRVAFVLARGVMDASWLGMAERIAALLAKFSTTKDTSPSAGFLFPQRPVEPLGALSQDGGFGDPVPAPLPADPPLPHHAYIYIEEGERQRSGERAWLAMEGQGQILKTFGGPDARQLARAWVGQKFEAVPAEEIEVPLPDEHPITDEAAIWD